MIGADGEPSGERPERAGLVASHLKHHAEIEVMLGLIGLQLNRALAETASFFDLPRGSRQGDPVMGEILRMNREIAVEDEDLKRQLEAAESFRVVPLQDLFPGELKKIHSFDVKHPVSRDAAELALSH